MLSRERQRAGVNEIARAKAPSQGRPSGAHTPVSVLESALDDLDLNEFGVAALEKTFDNSTVPHPSSVTIGTGCG